MSCNSQPSHPDLEDGRPTWQFHAIVISLGLPILRRALAEYASGDPGFAAAEAAVAMEEIEDAIGAILALQNRAPEPVNL